MRWSSAAPNWKSTRLLIATKCQLYRSTPKMAKQSAQLFEQLGKALEAGEGEEIVKKTKGLIVFLIDGEKWTLDSRSGSGKVYKGPPEKNEKPDLTLTISDENFVKLVLGKIGPQQAFLTRKLKISGSMALALKLQPVLDAAAPKAKL